MVKDTVILLSFAWSSNGTAAGAAKAELKMLLRTYATSMLYCVQSNSFQFQGFVVMRRGWPIVDSNDRRHCEAKGFYSLYDRAR